MTRPRLAARRRRQRAEPRRAVAPARAAAATTSRSPPTAREALALVAAAPSTWCCSTSRCPGMSGLEVLARIRAHAARAPSCRSSWSPPGPRAPTSSRRSASAPTTTSPSRSTSPWRWRASARTCRTSGPSRTCATARSATRWRCSGANDGLWDWNLDDQRGVLVAALEGDARPRGGGDRHEPGRMARARASRRPRARPGGARRRTSPAASGHYESEHRMLHRDGTFRWVLCRGAAIRNADGRGDAARRIADRHHRRQGGRRADRPAEPRAVRRSPRARHQAHGARSRITSFALLVLGLDRFKTVSDSLGPLTADRLLVAVAQRLQASLRGTDAVAPSTPASRWRASAATSSRCCSTTSPTRAMRCASRERLRAGAASKPFDVDGQQVFISATRRHRRQHDRLHASRGDAARRRRSRCIAPRRRHGRACELFDAGDARAARWRACGSRPTCGRRIERGAFDVHYQPIVDARQRRHRRLRGAGALAASVARPGRPGGVHRDRRRHRDDRADRAAGAAASRAGRWRRGGAQFGAAAPGVDVRQRLEPAVRGQRPGAATSKRSCARPAWTASQPEAGDHRERVHRRHPAPRSATLARLQAIGVEWSLDDFGTGYSSLSYLHRLQVDTREGRSLVRQPHRRRRDGAEMVRAIVALAHNLAMDVVAEGVETAQAARAAARARLRVRPGLLLLEAGAPRPRPAVSIAGAALARPARFRRRRALIGSLRLQAETGAV